MILLLKYTSKASECQGKLILGKEKIRRKCWMNLSRFKQPDMLDKNSYSDFGLRALLSQGIASESSEIISPLTITAPPTTPATPIISPLTK
jgi:hypothetical protein